MNFKYTICCLTFLLTQQCLSLYLFPIPRFIFGDVLYNYDINRTAFRDDEFYTGYITQDLDHFDIRSDGSRTWQQRYFYKNSYMVNYTYALGYAILEMMGPEGTPYMEYNEINEWAKYKRAMYYKLEHRYYGKSKPGADLSKKSFTYIEVAQVLVDAMNFIKKMEKDLLEHAGKTRIKWLITGQGYGGTLAAWFRAKYSNQIYIDIGGSISIDSPMVASAACNDFFDVADDVIRRGYQRSIEGRTCISNLEEIRTDFYSKLKNEPKNLQKMFNLCSNPIEISFQDAVRLHQLIFGVIPFMVQYNRNILFNSNYGYGNLCRKLEDKILGYTPLAIFGQFIRDLLKLTDHTCLDYSYDRLVADLSDSSNDSEFSDERIWLYQRCTQLGWFVSSSDPFFPYDYSYSQKLCSDVFGDIFSLKQLEYQVNNTNREFGGEHYVNSDSQKQSFFVTGLNDTWKSLKFNEANNVVYTIPDAAHGSFLMNVDPQEVLPAEMENTRRKVQDDFVNQILSDS